MPRVIVFYHLIPKFKKQIIRMKDICKSFHICESVIFVVADTPLFAQISSLSRNIINTINTYLLEAQLADESVSDLSIIIKTEN